MSHHISAVNQLLIAQNVLDSEYQTSAFVKGGVNQQRLVNRMDVATMYDYIPYKFHVTFVVDRPRLVSSYIVFEERKSLRVSSGEPDLKFAILIPLLAFNCTGKRFQCCLQSVISRRKHVQLEKNVFHVMIVGDKLSLLMCVFTNEYIFTSCYS